MVLTVALGVGLACAPATRTGGEIPGGWMEVAKDGWAMIVPADWETEPAWPYASISITRPSYRQRDAMRPSLPPPTFRALDATATPVDIAAPWLTLTVSRLARDGRALDAATRSYTRDRCFKCAPDLRRALRAVDVGGRRGMLSHVVRASGAHEWTLVVQNDCRTYVARVHVDADEGPRVADTVERVLASARVKGDGRLFGQCA